MKLEAGKKYKDRLGTIHGPLMPNSDADSMFPYVDGDMTWFENGRYLAETTNKYDLIEEVTQKNLKRVALKGWYSKGFLHLYWANDSFFFGDGYAPALDEFGKQLEQVIYVEES